MALRSNFLFIKRMLLELTFKSKFQLLKFLCEIFPLSNASVL